MPLCELPGPVHRVLHGSEGLCAGIPLLGLKATARRALIELHQQARLVLEYVMYVGDSSTPRHDRHVVNIRQILNLNDNMRWSLAAPGRELVAEHHESGPDSCSPAQFDPKAFHGELARGPGGEEAEGYPREQANAGVED